MFQTLSAHLSFVQNWGEEIFDRLLLFFTKERDLKDAVLRKIKYLFGVEPLHSFDHDVD